MATVGLGMGMNTVAYDPYLSDADFHSPVVRARTLAELVSRGDVVCVHVPLNPDNFRMFDADLFSRMKPGAVFVNAARGGLVDQEALLDALDSGRLFGAGLDATDPEPLDPTHPLLHRADVVVTPHIAAATDDARLRMFKFAVEQAMMVMDGRRSPNLVNPDSWERVLARLEQEG